MQTIVELARDLSAIQILGIVVVIFLLAALYVIIRQAARDMKDLPRYRRDDDRLDKDSSEVRTVEALLSTVLSHRDDQLNDAINVLKDSHEMIKTNTERIRRIADHVETNLGIGMAEDPQKKQ